MFEKKDALCIENHPFFVAHKIKVYIILKSILERTSKMIRWNKTYLTKIYC